MPLNNFRRNYMRNTVIKQEQLKMIYKTVVIILGKEGGQKLGWQRKKGWKINESRVAEAILSSYWQYCDQYSSFSYSFLPPLNLLIIKSFLPWILSSIEYLSHYNFPPKNSFCGYYSRKYGNLIYTRIQKKFTSNAGLFYDACGSRVLDALKPDLKTKLPSVVLSYNRNFVVPLYNCATVVKLKMPITLATGMLETHTLHF